MILEFMNPKTCPGTRKTRRKRQVGIHNDIPLDSESALLYSKEVVGNPTYKIMSARGVRLILLERKYSGIYSTTNAVFLECTKISSQHHSIELECLEIELMKRLMTLAAMILCSGENVSNSTPM